MRFLADETDGKAARSVSPERAPSARGRIPRAKTTAASPGIPRAQEMANISVKLFAKTMQRSRGCLRGQGMIQGLQRIWTNAQYADHASIYKARFIDRQIFSIFAIWK